MRRSHRVTLLLLTMSVLALGLVGCTVEQSVLDPKGPVAEKQLSLVHLSFWIMMGVTLIVAVILIYVLIRYRQRKGQTGIPVQTEGNKWLEITWIVIPVILLAILLVPTIKVTYELADEDRETEDAIEVTVTGKQFWWEFEYPDLGIVTANELHIPVGEKIHLKLEASDVIHSFWVPKLAGKTDTIPGRENYMWLQADEPGIYSGQCAEYCGSSHALMAFEVVAHEQGDFDDWVAQMKEPPSQNESQLVQQGEEIFAQSCASCHAVDSTDTENKLAGPNLGNFGNRNKLAAGILDNNKENLKHWLQDPQDVKPGNLMPDLKLNDEQAEALTEYLHSLK